MRQRLGLIGLTFAILLVGCGKDHRTPRGARLDEGTPAVREIVQPTPVVPGTPTTPTTTAELPADFPKATAQQLYEQALLEAVDALADRKYRDALASLEKARGYQDTETVVREIEKVRAVLDAEAAAERAVQDVKTVL